MVVIVAIGGQVMQKVVDIGEPLEPEELRRAAEYVNREFHGCPLLQVRDALLARLREERSLVDRLMRRGWDLASRSLEGTSQASTRSSSRARRRSSTPRSTPACRSRRSGPCSRCSRSGSGSSAC